MARAPRDPAPGIYHVTAHSISSGPLFRDDIDRTQFTSELARLAARPRWTCIATCLMSTHYHVLVDVADSSLPLGFHRLNGRYAQGFNARHRLRGHVFADRYGARRIDTDPYLMTAFRYIARNPLEAGLCAKPHQWAWSSYAASVGLVDGFGWCDVDRVLGCFGQPRAAAIGRLRAFVEAP
jgi:putative transposase